MSQSYDIVLYGKGNEDPGKEDPEKNNRSLPISCVCEITEDGVEIQGLGYSDILLYEICDVDGNFICISPDETSFLEILFSMSGTYGIRFILEEFTLTGMITI